MGIKIVRKRKSFVRGKGLQPYATKSYVYGRGIMDAPMALINSFLPAIKSFGETKDLAKNIGKSAVDVYNIVKSTKDLIGKKRDTTAEDVVRLIKGKGFKFVSNAGS